MTKRVIPLGSLVKHQGDLCRVIERHVKRGSTSYTIQGLDGYKTDVFEFEVERSFDKEWAKQMVYNAKQNVLDARQQLRNELLDEMKSLKNRLNSITRNYPLPKRVKL